MFCTHQRNNYGCTGECCRYNIAIILMIVNVFLLAHILFPHHHHFYRALCKQEQGHAACEVEIEKALLRVGAGRYDRCPVSPAADGLLLPVLPPVQAVCSEVIFSQDAGRLFLFSPFVSRYEALMCCGVLSLRAPPRIFSIVAV